MNKRVLTDLALLVLALLSPYQITFLVLFLAVIYFKFYWEGIIIAFLVSILYGSSYNLAIVVTLAVLILLPLRDKVRINA